MALHSYIPPASDGITQRPMGNDGNNSSSGKNNDQRRPNGDAVQFREIQSQQIGANGELSEEHGVGIEAAVKEHPL